MTTTVAPAQIDHLFEETRSFPPNDLFAKDANGTEELYHAASTNPELFWATQAQDLIDWQTPFTEILDWSNPPFARWFADGTLNVAYNCLDRHIIAGNGNRTAILWEGEPGDSRTISYQELSDEVNRLANVMTELGITRGDRVAIYLPMIPEAIAAMLATARLGAIHSVIFGGFAAESIRARIDDAGAKLVITADGGYRKGRANPLKATVDQALDIDTGTPLSVQNVLVVHRTNTPVNWRPGRDLWWHETVAKASTQHTAEAFDAENPLFILHTSGTTGKPKGVLHSSGGYLTQATFTSKYIHDLHPERDVYWCTADIGWITGHSYVVYGPLALGATQVIYEGTPDSPHPGRWWEIVQKYRVSVLYTAPTAIRSFMQLGRKIPKKFELNSLRLLGSVGEPINPEAWMWYRNIIGSGQTPIVDTWWQTETGAIMIAPMPGVTATKPGSAQSAVPGICLDVVDEDGNHVGNGNGGLLVITKPWPSMLRGIWGDDERFVSAYWEKFADKGYYFTGDGARLDQDGDIWLMGRVDDVMNVSGHRLSNTEIESALVAHDAVAEAGVVGVADEISGQAVVAFVVVKQSYLDEHTPERLDEELRAWVSEQIGAIARPKRVVLVAELPKTRSGKIIRRLLQSAAQGQGVGDTSTLADPRVMTQIVEALTN